MRLHRRVRRTALLLLVFTLASLLPQARATAQTTGPDEPPINVPEPGPGTPPAPEPTPLTVPEQVDPHLPSLVLSLQVAPSPIAVGETAVVTLTVSNQAPDPADNLRLSIAPADGTVPLAGTGLVKSGWLWTIARLPAYDERIVTATMQLSETPPGDALLLHAAANADGLSLPVQTIGGAIVVTRQAEARTALFQPGTRDTAQPGWSRHRAHTRQSRRPRPDPAPCHHPGCRRARASRDRHL